MRDEQERLLARNLESLSRSNAVLASSIASSAPAAAFRFAAARDGSLVPLIEGSGPPLPLHSLVDPHREARRLYDTVRGSGYVICLGLGGGFIGAAFSEDPEPLRLLVVEKDLQTLRLLFENISFAQLLADPRVILTAGINGIRPAVASSFIPAIAQDLRTLTVRPWCRKEQEFFDIAVREIEAGVEDARSDFSVQAHFGKRWFSNMISNIASVRPTRVSFPRAETAHVTAAGPSLELQLPALRDRRDGSLLVATDTSLPALLRSGIRPDVVVSLDCQLYSYHHFLTAGPTGSFCFFDLASPPFLTRRAASGPSSFFTSAHPFSRYVAERWAGFPKVDTTGGSVTHAAVSIAAGLGAATIHLHGADFSYPDGKAYARGTYLHDYFRLREDRLCPLESAFFSFIRHGPQLQRDISGGVPGGMVRYTTPVLLGYRDRLELLCSSLGAQVIPAEGKGVAIRVPGTRNAAPAGASARAPARFPDVLPVCGWKEFLKDYREQLQGLPSPRPPIGGWFVALTPMQAVLWSTILPITATVLRENSAGLERGRALEISRQWALQKLERLLSDTRG